MKKFGVRLRLDIARPGFGMIPSRRTAAGVHPGMRPLHRP